MQNFCAQYWSLFWHRWIFERRRWYEKIYEKRENIFTKRKSAEVYVWICFCFYIDVFYLCSDAINLFSLLNTPYSSPNLNSTMNVYKMLDCIIEQTQGMITKIFQTNIWTSFAEIFNLFSLLWIEDCLCRSIKVKIW